MEKTDLNKILVYFTKYSEDNEDKKYSHDMEDFHIKVYKDDSVYQTNSDHESQGIELDTLDNFRIRFKSFTGEDF